MDKKLTYLVCPLNWGLGHASRMIPVVYDILNQGDDVILGGDGFALKLISKEFPQLQTIHIPDIAVCFSGKVRLWNLIALLPKILYSSVREFYLLKRILKTVCIDVVISDNRYGLRNKKVKSVLVSHQLMVKLPKAIKWLEYSVHLLLKIILTKFDACWVPDYADKKKALSGDLSHKYKAPHNVIFKGPLSRFAKVESIPLDRSFEVVVILSGPEPLRSQLEMELRKVLMTIQVPTLIVQGNPCGKFEYLTDRNVTTVAHMGSEELSCALQQAAVVICRSGYSSIMDLQFFKVAAILIPTPGQTEQEYLAQYLSERYLSINQTDISSLLPSHLHALLFSSNI